VSPERIQLRRTKGWRKPEGAVSVARPTRWGNPYRVGDDDPWGDPYTAEECVRLFRHSINFWWDPYYAEAVRAELRGKDLACWCPIGAPCHADVLLEIANAVDAAVDDWSARRTQTEARLPLPRKATR